MRAFLIFLHRYMGLATAVLFIAGRYYGSILAFNLYGAGFGQHDTEAHGKCWLFFHGTDGRLPGQGTLGERFYRELASISGGASGRFDVSARLAKQLDRLIFMALKQQNPCLR